ncbi:MAG TPA: hypothetical protein P5556_07140 [Candidatus Gastranaerophilales bacterium]|nr:hypothetical protein [Candidatus Gastranaerophilales bacterium]
MQTENKVPFDPGFSDFSVKIPEEAFLVFDQITKLKQPHQKKFEFQKFEMYISSIIKNCVAVYLGCILWGSYLYYRHKNDPKEIYGNIIKEIPEDQRENLNYDKEINFIIELINKLNNASNYYLRKNATAGKELILYCEAYKEFTSLNNNFLNLENTDRIKLPNAVSHFVNYDDQRLDELKIKIEEIINSQKINQLLEIGFYKN